MKEPLEKFGAFLIENLRDKALDDVEMLLRGAWKSPSTQALQEKLRAFDADKKDVIREVADRIVTTAMHDFLFALQAASDGKQGIEVFVDGANIASLSDGLQGEIFSEKGWIARFSEFPDRQKG